MLKHVLVGCYVGEKNPSKDLKNKVAFQVIIITQWIRLTGADFWKSVNEEFPDIHNHSNQGVISGRQPWNVAVFGGETKHRSPVLSHFEEQTNHRGNSPAPECPSCTPPVGPRGGLYE